MSILQKKKNKWEDELLKAIYSTTSLPSIEC